MSQAGVLDRDTFGNVMDALKGCCRIFLTSTTIDGNQEQRNFKLKLGSNFDPLILFSPRLHASSFAPMPALAQGLRLQFAPCRRLRAMPVLKPQAARQKEDRKKSGL